MWRPLPKRVGYKVEKGKEYKIEAHFTQNPNWTASLTMDFGKEVPVQYDALIEKLKGVDVVVFAGGISAQWKGKRCQYSSPVSRGVTVPTLNFQKWRAIGALKAPQTGREENRLH